MYAQEQAAKQAANLQSMVGADAQIRPSGEIKQELLVLEQQIERLLSRCSHLHDRLALVSRPAPPQTVASGKPVPVHATELGRALAQLSERIGFYAMATEDAVARLEI